MFTHGLSPSTVPPPPLCIRISSSPPLTRVQFLSMLEKRALMQFLRLCMDADVEGSGEDVGTLNERSLARGRSLKRPQNKAASSSKEYVLGCGMNKNKCERNE